MKTYMAKTADQSSRQWYVVDATDQVLGRMASKLATILMGKHKPVYTPHIDMGDFVVVINAEKIVLTGRKAEQKFEKRYSGYPGGLRQVPYGEVLEKHPERLVEMAVKRMLPKSHLGQAMFTKLKVYAGSDHPHIAQCPKPFELSC